MLKYINKDIQNTTIVCQSNDNNASIQGLEVVYHHVSLNDGDTF